MFVYLPSFNKADAIVTASRKNTRRDIVTTVQFSTRKHSYTQCFGFIIGEGATILTLI